MGGLGTYVTCHHLRVSIFFFFAFFVTTDVERECLFQSHSLPFPVVHSHSYSQPQVLFPFPLVIPIPIQVDIFCQFIAALRLIVFWAAVILRAVSHWPEYSHAALHGLSDSYNTGSLERGTQLQECFSSCK